jgi:EAL domain-containing protein (putative c-di-GMP-specific phosphodiesterase class I)
VALARALGYVVTAEGVEDASTAAWLRSVGCDRAQGWHFAHPTAWQELLRRQPAALTPTVVKESA